MKDFVNNFCLTILQPLFGITSYLLGIETYYLEHLTGKTMSVHGASNSVIFVNENENENGEKRENNEFVNEN